MRISFRKKFLVYILVFIFGIGAGVGGTIVKSKVFPASSEQTVLPKAKEQIGPLVEFKEFIVNLAGGGMVKTEIAVEGVDTKSKEKINTMEIFLRDKIISVLGSKGIVDVNSPQGQGNLKKELITELNKVCEDQIKDVLFKNFVYSN